MMATGSRQRTEEVIEPSVVQALALIQARLRAHPADFTATAATTFARIGKLDGLEHHGRPVADVLASDFQSSMVEVAGALFPGESPMSARRTFIREILRPLATRIVALQQRQLARLDSNRDAMMRSVSVPRRPAAESPSRHPSVGRTRMGEQQLAYAASRYATPMRERLPDRNPRMSLQLQQQQHFLHQQQQQHFLHQQSLMGSGRMQQPMMGAGAAGTGGGGAGMAPVGRRLSYGGIGAPSTAAGHNDRHALATIDGNSAEKGSRGPSDTGMVPVIRRMVKPGPPPEVGGAGPASRWRPQGPENGSRLPAPQATLPPQKLGAHGPIGPSPMSLAVAPPGGGSSGAGAQNMLQLRSVEAARASPAFASSSLDGSGVSAREAGIEWDVAIREHEKKLVQLDSIVMQRVKEVEEFYAAAMAKLASLEQRGADIEESAFEVEMEREELRHKRMQLQAIEQELLVMETLQQEKLSGLQERESRLAAQEQLLEDRSLELDSRSSSLDSLARRLEAQEKSVKERERLVAMKETLVAGTSANLSRWYEEMAEVA